MEPTLYVELVDRTDPQRPFVVHRSPVTVTIDDEELFRTGDGWMVAGDDVVGGHQLGHGDVVVGVDREDPELAWLCEVVLVQGVADDRYYELSRLERLRR